MSDVITTVGKNIVAELIGGVDANADFDYLAVGTDGTEAVAGDTTLGAEITDSGLARAQITPSVTTNVLSLVKTWTATGAKTVQECGVLNAASSGTLLAHSDFDAISLTTDDQLQVTYEITIS